MTSELRLLLACARVSLNEEDKAAIRRLLFQGVDWTLFAQKAIRHELAALAGHTLTCVAPEMLPGEIRDAFAARADETRQRNRLLLDELALASEALANCGVEAIAFHGPVITTLAYGDLDFRMPAAPCFLIRDSDFSAAVSALGGLGYARRKQLTVGQLDLIHRLQGREILSKTASDIHICTRLTPMKLAVDIDYAAWLQRTGCMTLGGRRMRILSVEENLLALAVHGGTAGWRNASQACDVAAWLGSHQNLRWHAVHERARAQGCLRMVLLAIALARDHFGANPPDGFSAAEREDLSIEPMVRRISNRWSYEAPSRPAADGFSLHQLRLHDGMIRRMRHVLRAALLPAPHHVARIPLFDTARLLPHNLATAPYHVMSIPHGWKSPLHGLHHVSRHPVLGFLLILAAYFPFKIAHDVLLLPLVRAYRYLRAQSKWLRDMLSGYDFALAVMPISSERRFKLRQLHHAHTGAKRALAENPNNARGWHNLGSALSGLNRYREAIICFDKALALTPENRAIWNDRTNAIRAIKGVSIRDNFEEEPLLDPQDVEKCVLRAGFLSAAQRYSEAAAVSDCALAIDPKHLVARRIGIRSRLAMCDWRKREEDERQIVEAVRAGHAIITPFNHRSISACPAENLSVARLWAKGIPQTKALWQGEPHNHRRIRIAYLSAEFHDHATAFLIAGVFEHHDRLRFDTRAISLGPHKTGPMRRRIEAALDHFVDAHSLSDAEIARMIRDMEIDIVIDLNGQAGAARPGILAHRPAPAQVSYLGNCGTMGVPFIDYLIADRIVIPMDQLRHYTEKVIYLPNSYQCNDSRRPLPKCMLSRADAGLPEDAFVFCCFNNNHKIAPPIFDVWMRLLKSTARSVLWLLGDTPYVMHNLRREAEARGVAAQRLVFAPRVPVEDHLARHGLADLFLDTLPYNAHTTASDALWMGLPVLTILGASFPGRVAASLLHAVDLPELVASSLDEYETLALALARDPEKLAAIRAKLLRNRGTEALFDTPRFTRDLEAAYQAIWEQSQRGEPPASFSIPDTGRSG
jgi:predicted O-linked N-acetylglucosamine transferase (SPINDLY family)